MHSECEKAFREVEVENDRLRAEVRMVRSLLNRSEQEESKLNFQNQELERKLDAARDHADEGWELANSRTRQWKDVERLNDELRQHLKFVCMVAERLGPKAHGTHREEALAMLDGTIQDARGVLLRTENQVKECPALLMQPGPVKKCGLKAGHDGPCAEVLADKRKEGS